MLHDDVFCPEIAAMLGGKDNYEAVNTACVLTGTQFGMDCHEKADLQQEIRLKIMTKWKKSQVPRPPCYWKQAITNYCIDWSKRKEKHPRSQTDVDNLLWMEPEDNLPSRADDLPSPIEAHDFLVEKGCDDLAKIILALRDEEDNRCLVARNHTDGRMDLLRDRLDEAETLLREVWPSVELYQRRKR